MNSLRLPHRYTALKVSLDFKRYTLFRAGLGLFRQLLHDLINTMHNSNRRIRQVTLTGEVLWEYRFYVIGFVPANVVRLKKDVWFSKLNSEQVDSVDQFLMGSGYP